MSEALRASFETAVRRKFGWGDQKLEQAEEDPGVYTDPEVQVAFDTWVMAKTDSEATSESKAPDLPKQVHAYYKGLVEGPNGKDKKWTMGITTTELAELPGSLDTIEDTRWMNQIECHGKTRKEAEKLRDAILGFLVQYNKDPMDRIHVKKAS